MKCINSLSAPVPYKTYLMKTFLLTTSLILLFSVSVFSQETELPQPPTQNASNVYAEFFGPALIYSINYDGRFNKKDHGLGFRIGAGGFYADGDGYYMIPFGLNYLLGANGHYFEMGAGASVGDNNNFFEPDSDLEEFSALGYLTLGYRRQAFKKRGFVFRGAFNPVFGKDFFIPYVAVAVGFRF